MFRKAKWLAAAALVLPTAACVESMDASYGSPSYGYDNGYYSGSYYAAPQASYYSPPVVYSQTTTRYVPVPTPVPVPARQADRSNDHRWDGHRDQPQHDQPRHVDRQPSPTPPAAHNGGSSSGARHDGKRDADRDRNGDGRPDRRN